METTFQTNLRKLKHPATIGIDNEGKPIILNSDGSVKIEIVIPGVDINTQVTCMCSCYTGVRIVNVWESSIIAGIVYEVSRVFTGVGNGASAEMIIRCPAASNILAHININADCEIAYSIVESPAVSVAGTQLIAYNLNRSSENLATALIYHTPTTTGGTSISSGVDGSGKNVNAGTALGARVFKAGTDYLIRATNRSGNNDRDMSINVEFTERAA